MGRISTTQITESQIQEAIQGSLVSNSEAAELCPANLPKLPVNATYEALVRRAQNDAALYSSCAIKHATLVEAIRKKEESVDLAPVGR